jgi:hypothetical protein
MGPQAMLGLQGASTLAGMIGGVQQGSAASSAAKYQAQVARNNATIAQQNAEYTSQAGETAAQAQGLKSRATLGSISAAQSASGLSLGSPSLEDVREGASNVLRLDTANIAANAALRTRAFQAQAADYEATAALDTKKAADATTAGYINAAGSLLSGASSFADKWTRYTTPAKPYPT